MEWLSLLVVGILLVLVVQIVRILLADCDLTLWWAKRFGKKPEELAGKVVWITGASSGIGEQLAYRLAQAKCKLILSARREGELQRVKKQCLLHGQISDGDVFVLPLDMRDYPSHQTAVVRVLNHFDQIDILVNNAGRSQRAITMKTSLEVDKQMVELNVFGVLSLTKAVLPHMTERKQGHLVVTSSVAGKIGTPFSAAYSLSKFALHGWFEALRIELLPDNIKVSMICPGPVFSAVMEEAFTEDPDKPHGVVMKPGENRMTAERCADLMAVAMANQLSEAWPTRNPILLLLYLNVYMPTIARWISMTGGTKSVRRMASGKEHLGASYDLKQM